jgi:hypothetical protein
MFLLCLGVLCCANVAECSRKKLSKAAIKPDAPTIKPDGPSLSPTISGYLSVNSLASSEMFFVFYEAQEPRTQMEDTPILLWLQVCSCHWTAMPGVTTSQRAPVRGVGAFAARHMHYGPSCWSSATVS